MYAVVRRFEGVTNTQEVARIVKEGFLPIISEMPGFVAYYWVDAGDGVVVSTSVFEHKEAEEQSTYRAGEFVQEHLAAFYPNPPQVTAGEVEASATSTGPVSAVTDTVGGATDTVGGTVSGTTDSVRGVTDKLLGGGEEKQR